MNSKVTTATINLSDNNSTLISLILAAHFPLSTGYSSTPWRGCNVRCPLRGHPRNNNQDLKPIKSVNEFKLKILIKELKILFLYQFLKCFKQMLSNKEMLINWNANSNNQNANESITVIMKMIISGNHSRKQLLDNWLNHLAMGKY